MDLETSAETGLILLVEDDLSVREFLAQCLEAAGYEFLQAGSGQEALDLFRKEQDRISLLLTDIVMPGIFGDQLALCLLERKPSLKVVYMSGNNPNSLQVGTPLTMGKNFLQKPFSIE